MDRATHPADTAAATLSGDRRISLPAQRSTAHRETATREHGSARPTQTEAERAAHRKAQAEARSARASARAAARAIPPVRVPELAHLTLDGLRSYRTSLREEEDRVSYWRRILQARWDTLNGGNDVRSLPSLSQVLTDDRVASGRAALVRVVPVDDIPPLPQLGELWTESAEAADEESRTDLLRRLGEAEEQLSDYRGALHRRLEAATTELIARYRENPLLCLSALPLPAEELAAC
jgi:hypothetical protein